MNKISSFNRNNLAQLRPSLQQRLNEVGEEFGIAISLGSMSFSSAEATSRVTMTAVGDNVRTGESVSDSKARIEFVSHAWKFNLKPEDFGKVVTVSGKSFEIVGLKPRSSKYPILGKDTTSGDVFKLPAESVKSQLAA